MFSLWSSKASVVSKGLLARFLSYSKKTKTLQSWMILLFLISLCKCYCSYIFLILSLYLWAIVLPCMGGSRIFLRRGAPLRNGEADWWHFFLFLCFFLCTIPIIVSGSRGVAKEKLSRLTVYLFIKPEITTWICFPAQFLTFPCPILLAGFAGSRLQVSLLAG